KEIDSVDSLQNISVQQKLELTAEIARVKQLLKDQENEIKLWKDNYNQLLDELKNKQNTILKESLNDILNDDLKQLLITEKIEKKNYKDFNEFKS
ncbi:9018_t:CDS:1, partial [Scutellospora calospora]